NYSAFESQLRAFNKVLDFMENNDYPTGIIHAANSACILQHPESNFQMARMGIVMYGLAPSLSLRDKFDYRPAMSVHARIVDVRNVPVGQGVSYGHRYISTGSVTICTLPIGYADGLSRALSDKIYVLYNGVLCKQVGTICMDDCMFEVDLRLASTKNLHPQVGDEVIIVGASEGKELTLDIMADELGTINYEIACGFGLRLPKIYTI
ncbi:MAG: alanine racemase, partial [Eggerthellaceae bacterium]|nr:alanine racemase [Eggerthellaceae bacterium]